MVNMFGKKNRKPVEPASVAPGQTEPLRIPKAWYPDPTGRHESRWWDGECWLDYVTDGTSTGEDSPENRPSSDILPEGFQPIASARHPWTPVLPNNASHMPLEYLLHIFIFTDGNGQDVLGSRLVIGMLQDTAEAALEDFMGIVPSDIIAHSDVANQLRQTGQFPESAWEVMGPLDSQNTFMARMGAYKTVVRTFSDPRTNEQIALVLIYRT